MKCSTAAFLVVARAAAFPAAVEERQLPGPNPGLSQTFNENQLIDVSGVHKFVPPNFAAGDQRGPCPGLNALANHGYLPHNGIANIPQFIAATNQVWGMGLDVSTVFAVYGALVAGDGLTWSIGGPPSSGISRLVPNLLGAPKGISFSHNEYEGDGSATRNDFYESGDDFRLNMDYFKDMYNLLPATNFAAFQQHRSDRIQKSINRNPYFFNGPFAGIAIAGGANSFLYRLAANHSAEHPQGILTKETFATIWSVSGSGDDLTWTPGHDRIPENWYRRPFDDEYSFPFAGIDIASYFTSHPDTIKIGGNTGTTNSFTGVNVEDLTGGAFNAADLLDGNKAACFAYQAGALAAPDILSGLFADITGPLAQLNKAFGDGLAPLNCPQLKKLDTKGLQQFPGYTDPKAHA